ncbi:mitochondrial uncoupling protein 4 [Coccinella septempunctata]|uniref:mitochondrial uncoupling protein 4 n=1 Tax=Coccinella septempunctata TaxID=41139 RepID=UPI001D061FD9|nr:mitochondrial uncoupling protein 4 [Coccinella septempunctata]XP_044758643.1 mitochondrial uncoupling protein 4 [Coccinella septempunctata]XP_044758644.1 mitochondrial uncoupling protein 4 [Coccinella septempunctata]
MPPVPPQKELPNYADSLWVAYSVSVLAAWNSEFVTYPLDLIKTRLQIQGEIANKQEEKLVKAPKRGMFRTTVGIVKEEGVTKLWQGVSAALVRHMIYSGTRIVSYITFKEKVFKKGKKDVFPIWQSAICGVSAGAFAQFIASPTDLLKVQLQMEGKRKIMGLPPRVTGLFDAFNKIVKSSGYRGLWKGSIPNVQRAALVNLGDLTTYDTAKRFILRNTSLEDNHFCHLLASACAGLVAAGLGTPADVVKTRVMNQPLDEHGRGMIYKGSIDCLLSTIKNEGFPALYKGFFPIWLRMAPWSLTFWISYEEILKTLGAKQF